MPFSDAFTNNWHKKTSIIFNLWQAELFFIPSFLGSLASFFHSRVLYLAQFMEAPSFMGSTSQCLPKPKKWGAVRKIPWSWETRVKNKKLLSTAKKKVSEAEENDFIHLPSRARWLGSSFNQGMKKDKILLGSFICYISLQRFSTFNLFAAPSVTEIMFFNGAYGAKTGWCTLVSL